MRALLSSLSRLASCRRGVTAVEFAFVAPIFLPLLIAIMAYGVLFFTMSTVQHEATNQAWRIRDGGANFTVNDIKTAICAGSYQMLDCSNAKFFLDVSPINPNSTSVDDPTADHYVYTAGQVHALRLVYPFSLPVPEIILPMITLRINILFYGR